MVECCEFQGKSKQFEVFLLELIALNFLKYMLVVGLLQLWRIKYTRNTQLWIVTPIFSSKGSFISGSYHYQLTLFMGLKLVMQLRIQFFLSLLGKFLTFGFKIKSRYQRSLPKSDTTIFMVKSKVSFDPFLKKINK